jgi:4-aminobutyrate--pyruvate transaminase
MIVADEVITGFGRLGTPFGCDLFEIDPDIMVLSKQLTSSYQPLAAVLISDELFQGVANNSGKIGTFGHGFTASGHPVAAAVALENLNIIAERGWSTLPKCRRCCKLVCENLKTIRLWARSAASA